MHRAPKRAGGLRHSLAFGITILIHVALGAALLLMKQPIIRPLVEHVLYLAPPVPPPPPPPPPEPVRPEIKPPEPVTPQLTEAPKPIEKPRKPAPAAAPPAARPPANDGPPVHYFGGPGAGTGVATSGLGSVGDGTARHAPSDYAEKVKARILANKVFPMEAQLKRQECVITYSVTVDKSGHMIAHHIDPCLYPLVNQAAEQAILKSGPYEPPENGADTRVVYGTLPFHLEIQLPPVHPSR
jgi:periplasmic protein TonB